jgi:hypothetical protein
MTSEQPLVTKRIPHRAGSLAVELVLQRPQNRRAGGNRLIEGRIDIGHVQVNGNTRSPKRVRSRDAVLRIFIGQHDRRRTDFDLSMPNAPIRLGQAELLVCIKRAGIEIDGRGGTVNP